MYNKDVQFMKNLLPDCYICEKREKGVHCHSEKGIPDDQGYDDHWGLIYKAIQQHFGERFMEVFFQTTSYYRKFTVYLRPDPKMEAAKKIASSAAYSGLGAEEVSQLNLKD